MCKTFDSFKINCLGLMWASVVLGQLSTNRVLRLTKLYTRFIGFKCYLRLTQGINSFCQVGNHGFWLLFKKQLNKKKTIDTNFTVLGIVQNLKFSNITQMYVA